MYRTAGTAFIDCDYNKQQPYTVYFSCWQNIYKCICNIMSIVNSVYCNIQCDINTTKLPYNQHTLSQPTITLYNIHLYWRALKVNFNCILFTFHWQPTHWLLFTTQTAQYSYHHHVRSRSLCCFCNEHSFSAKYCALINRGKWMFNIFLL